MAGGRSADRPDGIVPELCEELLPLIPGLASCLGHNALTAREPQQADDRVETMCRPTGRCLHLLYHRRNRPPRCSMRRELVVPCFEIPRGPRMSSPRSQERSTRSGQRGETAAWLGGIVIALPDLVKGLGRRTAPHREGAVTSLIESAGHPHVLSDFVDIDVVRRTSGIVSSRWTHARERRAVGIALPAWSVGSRRISPSKSSRQRSDPRSTRSGSKPRVLC